MEQTETNAEVDSPIAVDWKSPPTLMELKKDLEHATPAHSAHMQKLDTWLENLNIEGQAKPKSPKGNSSVQPKLIRKLAEWRYAALSEPFLSSPDIFDVSPVSWEDKKAAIQNQLLLNNQFNTKINKTVLIDEYVRTAVDEGTVFLRVGWDFEEEEYTEEVPVVSFRAAPDLEPMYQQLTQLQTTNPAQYQAEVMDYIQQAHQHYLTTGEVTQPIVTGQETVKRMRTVRNCPTVEVCNTRNLTVDPSCNGDISKAGFVIYSFESSVSELEKSGLYTNLDQINKDTNSILGDPDHESENGTDFNFSDEARKKFVVHEYWGFRDIHDTDRVVPIVAAWVGNTMIRMEENPFPDQQLPFVKVQYLPVRRSIYGEPDGSLLDDNQRIIGAVTRGMIDLLAKSANGQTGMRKGMLDAVNRRRFERGQDYEYNQGTDPRQGVHQHQFPEIPASAQWMLQSQNAEAEAMTGARAFGATNTQGINDSATAARGVLDAASKRELGILRRLADGMIQVGRKIIAMNAEFLDDEEVVRVTNEEFIPVRRDDLAGNFDLRLTISTAEEDDKKAQELAFMLQTTGPNEDPGLRKLLLADIARLRKMPDLAKRLEAYEPQPDPIEQEVRMLQVQLLQAQIANEQAQAYERQAGGQLDQAKADNVQSDTDQKNLDFVEQESGVTQERQKELHSAQAEANARLKVLEHSLNQQIGDKSRAEA